MDAKLSLQLERHQRRFLFSSISHEKEKSLQQKIEFLHGKVVVPVKNTFSPLCTHVIAREFAPTEKVLGALAGGKWLLTPDYIQDSYKKGYWLSEEEYEYTNFNKVAAYHRHKRELRKCGLYDGWKILVVMDTPTSSRTFKRILAAGGAEVATKEDISGIDFVITTKEMLKFAQAIVDSLIPLVDVSYIKGTLIFANDPADLKKCDLRDQRYFETICKSAVSVSSTSRNTHIIPGSHASSRRPVSETSLAKRKQTCSKSKQTTLTQFLKPVIKQPSPNNKPSEGRQSAAKNNSLPFTNSFVRSSQCNTQPYPPVIYDVEDEVETINISKKEKTKAKPSVGVIPMPSTTHSAKLMKCYVNLGKKIDEHLGYISERPSKDLVTLANFSRRQCIEQNMTQSEQFKRDSMTLKISPKKQLLENYTSPDQLHGEAVPSKYLPRKQSLQYNTDSSEELQKQALPSKTPSFTIRKPHARKVIVNFLRTRKYLSEVCCTNILSIPIGSEHYSSTESKPHCGEIDEQQVLDTPSYHFITGEHRELTAREINLYTCFVTPELHDQELHVHGLDTLLIQLSTYLYPPPAILGTLLKDLVLETPFRIVHSRALRVAYRILSLHSPVTRKMREYYSRVLEITMQHDTSGNYTAWKFIQSVIQCASYKDSDKEIMLNQNMEEEEGFDKVTKALNLLEFITILITEDVKNSAYGEAVQELLTWDVFWGSSRTCSVLSPPVKQLLRLWMSQQTTSLTLKQNLAQLVSVLLEVMWKFSGHPLVPVTVLPDTLAAVKKEIGIHIKGLSSQQSLEVIRSLHIPWAQSVVTFIILQEIAQCPKEITLSSIVDLFNSTSKHSNSNAVFKPESVKKDVNNQSLNMKDQSSRASRSSIRNINKRNSKGETALLRACIKNDVEQVKHLLKEPDVDITLSDYCGWTPLHEAAIRGHVKCIKLLFNHNTQSNRGTLNSYFKKGGSSLAANLFTADFKERRTALHDAVIANRLESVKLLLDYGGEDLLKAKTIDGQTAFDLASNEEMLRLLKIYKSRSVDGKSRSISPTMEDHRYHKELFLILANCYLEVSGNRYFFYTIKKCIYKVVKDSIKGKEAEKVNDPCAGDMDYECQAVDKKMKKETMKNHAPQYLNLIENEILERLSQLEETAVAKIYNCIRLDKEVHKKRSLQSVAPVKKIDIKHFFRTLCL